MSTFLDAHGVVHAPLLTKGGFGRTMCTPTGLEDEHLIRCGMSVDCPGCLATRTALDTFTGPRYDVTRNGSIMGGGSDFRSGLASLVRVSLRYPDSLFRLHDDLDTGRVLVEVRNGEVQDITNE